MGFEDIFIYKQKDYLKKRYLKPLEVSQKQKKTVRLHFYCLSHKSLDITVVFAYTGYTKKV